MSQTKKIRELTPAQGRELEKHCARWSRFAVATEPADRAQAEKYVKAYYAEFNPKFPEPRCVWVDSFKEAASVAAQIDEEAARKFRGQLLRCERNYLLSDVNGHPFTDQDFIGWRNELRTLQEIARYAPEGIYTDKLLREVRRSLRRIPRLPSPVTVWQETLPRETYEHYLVPSLGQDACREFAFSEFFAFDGGIARLKTLQKLVWVTISCGYFWMYPGLTIFMERPSIFRLDESGRPHCLDGPAVRYPDGSELYAIHGIMVPKKYIDAAPEEIDLRQVLVETNASVRLAIISKVGFPRLMDTARHWVISSAGGNSLLEFRLGTTRSGTQFMRALHLKWRDKIGEKETLIPVPRAIGSFGKEFRDIDPEDCEQVRRWTLGWPKDALAVAET